MTWRWQLGLGLGFPLVLLCCIPIRAQLLPRLFSRDSLAALDSQMRDTDDE